MPFAAALSEHPRAQEAVGEVIGAVVDHRGTEPDLAVLFVTGVHTGSFEELCATVRTLVRPRVLLGATAVSVIGGSREAEEGPAVSLWAAWGLGSVHPVRLEVMRTDGGALLVGLPAEAVAGPRTLVVISDPFTFPADALVDHLAADAPALRTVGGLASAARMPGGNRLALDGEVFSDGAVGVLLDGALDTVVSQGCRPVGMPYTVTRAEGNVVAELGGRPAVERLQELAMTLDPEERQLLAQGVHLGRVIDEHKVDFTRGDFLIRTVFGADQASGALVVGDEVSVGDTVQFQVRDAASADEDLRLLLADRSADAALVFTCNGRGRHLFDEPDHDAAAVSRLLGADAVGGMFCAGEVGPVGGRSFLHGFTASVALFRDEDHDRDHHDHHDHHNHPGAASTGERSTGGEPTG